jgi:hypothetical protein
LRADPVGVRSEHDWFPSVELHRKPGWPAFTCDDEDCGRRLVIDRNSGEMVVIDHGDRAALHRGFVGEVEMSPAQVR